MRKYRILQHYCVAKDTLAYYIDTYLTAFGDNPGHRKTMLVFGLGLQQSQQIQNLELLDGLSRHKD